jgi:hypothetical protein
VEGEGIPGGGADIRGEAEDRRAVGNREGRIAEEKISDLNRRMIFHF